MQSREQRAIKARSSSRWAELKKLIQEYAEAVEADSWKGGGDPDAIPILEKELELATLKLNHHLEAMERHYEEFQD